MSIRRKYNKNYNRKGKVFPNNFKSYPPEQYESIIWKKKREKILDRDGHKCQKCFKDDSKYELHVHHLDYENKKYIYDVTDKSLITLCVVCHREIHKETKYNYDYHKNPPCDEDQLKEVIVDVKEIKKYYNDVYDLKSFIAGWEAAIKYKEVVKKMVQKLNTMTKSRKYTGYR